MSTHKDEKNGTWYVMVRYHDWDDTLLDKQRNVTAAIVHPESCPAHCHSSDSTHPIDRSACSNRTHPDG